MANKQGGIKDIAVGRSDVYRLAPSELHEKPGWNTRDPNDPSNIEHIESLAVSIAEIGVHTPLRVYWEDNKAYVSDGHCRLAAVKLAIKNGNDIRSVPVITENRYANEADRVFTMIVGNSGKQLTPLETARVYKRLIDLGWSEKEIAARSGKTIQHVSSLLKLNTAPPILHQMVSSGLMSATLANKIFRQNPEQSPEVLVQAVQTAKKAGKKRITERDIGQAATGKTFKTEIREIFGRAEEDEDEEDGSIGFWFKPADAERLKELIKVE